MLLTRQLCPARPRKVPSKSWFQQGDLVGPLLCAFDLLPVLHSPAAFLASSRSTYPHCNSLCSEHKDTHDPDVTAAETQSRLSIGQDAAWRQDGAPRIQSYLSNLCDARSLDSLMQRATQGDPISLELYQVPGELDWWKVPTHLSLTVFDGHASARNLATSISERLSTTSNRTPDIDLELAQRVSSSLHRDSACPLGSQGRPRDPWPKRLVASLGRLRLWRMGRPTVILSHI